MATPSKGSIMQKRSVQKAVDARYGEGSYEVIRRVAVNSSHEQVWQITNYADGSTPFAAHAVIKRIEGRLIMAGLAL